MATRRRICRIRVLAKNSPVWRIRVLAKMAISAILAGLDTFADIRQPVLVGLDTFARHSPTTFPGLDTFAKGKFGEFSEFSEFGEFSECRLDRFIHIKYVICA